MHTDAQADKPHKIVPLERGDLQAQAALCSRAFWSDPLFNFLYRTDAQKETLLPMNFVTYADHCLKYGCSYKCVDERGELLGVVVAVGPNDENELWPEARWENEWLPVHRDVAAAKFPDDQVHERLVTWDVRSWGHTKDLGTPGDLYFIAVLATSVGARNKGVASALLKTVTDQADRRGKDIVLESSNLLNVPFYERRGFRTMHEERADLGGGHSVTTYLMRRQPAVKV